MKVERIVISKINQVENSRGSADKNISQLMDSIQQHGLKQPIGVNFNKDGSYTIAYGNRRLNAAIKLGWKTIPAVIETGMDLKQLLINNLIENAQRENVTPVEIGRICDQLQKEFKMTAGEIAIKLSMAESTIKSLLHIYTALPEDIRQKVVFHKRGMKKNGKLSVSAVEKVLRTRTTLGLSAKKVSKLLEYTRINELSNEDIKILTLLTSDGLPFESSLIERKKYRILRVDVPVLMEEVLEMANKKKVRPINYLTRIIYGLESPISKPSFLKAI